MAAPTVEVLMDEITDSIAARRRTLRFIESQRFREAYRKANPDEKALVVGLIQRDAGDALEGWVRRQLQQEYSGMTLKELRAVGQSYGITNYQRLPKDILLDEVVNYARVSGRLVASADA